MNFIASEYLFYPRFSVSTDVGLASNDTSASDGRWQILATVSSTEEMVKGSARLGVPSKNIKYNVLNK